MSKATRAKEETPIVDWVAFDWHKAEQTVYRLQKRISKAKERGNLQGAHNLERKLLASYSGRMLAVRKVTRGQPGKAYGWRGRKEKPEH